MLQTVIRKEHKNDWEKRVALTPRDISDLRQKGFPITVESSHIRIYSDKDYQASAIDTSANVNDGQFVVGIKEPPVDSIQPNQVHLAFSHTIKGQTYNMPLLQKFIDQKATLIDYEPIVDSNGKRTIAFGRFAGIAGAIDSFHAAGEKNWLNNKASPLTQIKQTWQYKNLQDVKKSFADIDLNIGLNAPNGKPVRVLIVGSGNVGKGCEEVCQWLGLQKVDVEELLSQETLEGNWYAVASSRHIHQAKDGSPFDMNDFVEHGKEKYVSTFDKLLGKFDILLQTPYWTDKYPKHLDRERMMEFRNQLPDVIGDISCDINGSLECTQKPSCIDNPIYTYFVESDSIVDGIKPEGIAVMAIDNLPCELSLDASDYFSERLKGYMPLLINMDLSQPFENCGLTEDLLNAVIVYNGNLTPKYHYLEKFL
ncbi:MAG: alanine dehydrogenase [Gammaproteobacteria bacterium]|nr:alanine dehydrogenase [Gammaproteobacteria bacterium]